VTAGQTVVVVASNGGAPEEPNDYVVPDGILGSQASDAERLLKESSVEVKVEIASLCPRTTSSPLTRRQAKRPKPELLSWQSPLADDATHSLNMLDCFLINSSARTSDLSLRLSSMPRAGNLISLDRYLSINHGPSAEHIPRRGPSGTQNSIGSRMIGQAYGGRHRDRDRVHRRRW
jgi:hypothetical protein